MLQNLINKPFKPSSTWFKNSKTSKRSRHESSSVYMHSKAAFRRSRPSSTVCLNGPISTSRTSSFCKRSRSIRKFPLQCNVTITLLTLTLVSLYSWGKTESSKSRISDGLLWAAELKAIKATLRTFRSSSYFKNKVNGHHQFLVPDMTKSIVPVEFEGNRPCIALAKDQWTELDQKLWTWLLWR